LIRTGHLETGPRYYWKAVNSLRMAGTNDDAIRAVIAAMNEASAIPPDKSVASEGQ
jgi:hypothetical protein